MAKKSIPARCLAMSGLFEAEHPFAEDVTFRQQLLETAAEVLRAADKGEKFIDGVLPAEMNLVAALWYAEWNSAIDAEEGPLTERKAWLNSIRKSLPSCFCSQDNLG
ncbi:MAG: hypothetical protein FJ271_32720 [Planctomycetes bacterium]|nr:hypothetical protein [Planctomycetota bacterium]